MKGSPGKALLVGLLVFVGASLGSALIKGRLDLLGAAICAVVLSVAYLFMGDKLEKRL